MILSVGTRKSPEERGGWKGRIPGRQAQTKGLERMTDTQNGKTHRSESTE